MILLPLLAITALVMKVEFASAFLEEICSDESTPLELYVRESIEIQSPDYPNKYPNNVKCGWNVNPIGTENVRISCSNFDMENPNKKKKCEDFLQIEKTRYCGKNGPVDVQVNSKKRISLKFVSNNKESGNGFHCTVTALANHEESFNESFQLTLTNEVNYIESLKDTTSDYFASLKKKVEDSVGNKITKRPFDLKKGVAKEHITVEGRVRYCSFKWKDIENMPLIWNQITSKIVYPKGSKNDRFFRVVTGTKMIFICPGTFGKKKQKNYLRSFNETVSDVDVMCAGTKFFLNTDLQSIDPKELSCYRKIKSKPIRKEFNKAKDSSCGPKFKDGEIEVKKGTLHYIGIDYNGKIAMPLIDVCYDKERQETYWTMHTLHGNSIPAHDISDYGRPAWTFDKSELREFYSIISQRDLFFDNQVDLQRIKLSICKNFEYYFAKGHMSPHADFITHAEQDATYHITNSVPQWHAFNNGNWKFIEEGMRKLAEPTTSISNDGKELKIISGGFRILNMIKVNGKQIPIYLRESTKTLPVPAFTWKVVHDAKNNRASAFIVTNNPNTQLSIGESIGFAANKEGELMIEQAKVTTLCETENFNWIKNLKSEVAKRGYTYCLSYEDLKKVVTYVPELTGVIGLLERPANIVTELG